MSDGQFQKMALLHKVRLFKFITCTVNQIMIQLPIYIPTLRELLIMFAKICLFEFILLLHNMRTNY